MAVRLRTVRPFLFCTYKNSGVHAVLRIDSGDCVRVAVCFFGVIALLSVGIRESGTGSMRAVRPAVSPAVQSLAVFLLQGGFADGRPSSRIGRRIPSGKCQA